MTVLPDHLAFHEVHAHGSATRRSRQAMSANSQLNDQCRVVDDVMQGGRFSKPVRRGDTVERRAGPSGANVHALLRHFERVGFALPPTTVGTPEVPGKCADPGVALSTDKVQPLHALMRGAANSRWSTTCRRFTSPTRAELIPTNQRESSSRPSTHIPHLRPDDRIMVVSEYAKLGLPKPSTGLSR
jgi:hypothetical protein